MWVLRPISMFDRESPTLDYRMKYLLGKFGGGEVFLAAKVAESCGSEACRNLIKLKRLFLFVCTGVPASSWLLFVS